MDDGQPSKIKVYDLQVYLCLGMLQTQSEESTGDVF